MPRIAAATAVVPLPPAWAPPDLDRASIEAELRHLLASPASPTPIQHCMEYAVLGQGQRIRPLLAVRVGRLCGSHEPLVLRAAAAAELVHCASLIVDDLPSMDNEQFRRGKPAAHVAFGEAPALLAAFGLVALAARSVTQQPAPERFWTAQRRYQHALLTTLDCSALIGGQMMDLELAGDRREAGRDRMNELKTVPLFLLAIEAGAAYADAPPYPLLKRFGREFGAAFQLTDDYLDGELAGRDRLDRQFRIAHDCLTPFGSAGDPLRELIEWLEERAAAADRRHR